MTDTNNERNKQNDNFSNFSNCDNLNDNPTLEEANEKINIYNDKKYTLYESDSMIASFVDDPGKNATVHTPLINSPLSEDDIKTDRNNQENSYYPKFLILIGIFYILPSLQFVFFQSKDETIFCYYNYKCFIILILSQHSMQ